MPNQPVKTEIDTIGDLLIPCQDNVLRICKNFFISEYWIDKHWIKDFGFKSALECYLNEDVHVVSTQDWKLIYNYIKEVYSKIQIQELRKEIVILQQLQQLSSIK